MAKIRVTPSLLLEAAHELQRISEVVEDVGGQVKAATDRAPSYEGQFGPKVKPLGLDAMIRSQKLAQNLSALAEVLRNKGEEFESADLVGVEGLAGILSKFATWLPSDRLLHLVEFPRDYLTRLFNLSAMLNLDNRESIDEDWKPPWYGPIVIELAKFWTWYDQKINRFVYQDIGLQVPGLPDDGPITHALETLSAVDVSGNQISIVGSDVVRLSEKRGGVFVWFSDTLTGGNAGVAPMLGLVWLPERYRNSAVQGQIDEAILVAHELGHVFQRDLPEFPDGTPSFMPRGMHTGSWPWNPDGFHPFDFSFEYGSPFVGDFTLYMEVQSNIVEKAIKYDFLQADLLNATPGTDDYDRIQEQMNKIANKLATYTGNAEVACAYVVQEYGEHGTMYIGEMVKEAAFGTRIPPGGWEYWLRKQGFSEKAIQHIIDIANQGTPIDFPLNDIFDSHPDTIQEVQPSEIPIPSPTSTPHPPDMSDAGGPTSTPTTETPTPTPPPDI